MAISEAVKKWLKPLKIELEEDSSGKPVIARRFTSKEDAEGIVAALHSQHKNADGQRTATLAHVKETDGLYQVVIDKPLALLPGEITAASPAIAEAMSNEDAVVERKLASLETALQEREIACERKGDNIIFTQPLSNAEAIIIRKLFNAKHEGVAKTAPDGDENSRIHIEIQRLPAVDEYERNSVLEKFKAAIDGEAADRKAEEDTRRNTEALEMEVGGKLIHNREGQAFLPRVFHSRADADEVRYVLDGFIRHPVKLIPADDGNYYVQVIDVNDIDAASKAREILKRQDKRDKALRENTSEMLGVKLVVHEDHNTYLEFGFPTQKAAQKAEEALDGGNKRISAVVQRGDSFMVRVDDMAGIDSAAPDKLKTVFDEIAKEVDAVVKEVEAATMGVRQKEIAEGVSAALATLPAASVPAPPVPAFATGVSKDDADKLVVALNARNPGKFRSFESSSGKYQLAKQDDSLATLEEQRAFDAKLLEIKEAAAGAALKIGPASPAPIVAPEVKEARDQLLALSAVLAKKLEANLDPANKKIKSGNLVDLGKAIASHLPEVESKELERNLVTVQEQDYEPEKQLALATRVVRESMAQLAGSLTDKEKIKDVQDKVRKFTGTPEEQLNREVADEKATPTLPNLLPKIPEMPALTVLTPADRAKALHAVLNKHLDDNLTQTPPKIKNEHLIDLSKAVAHRLPDAEYEKLGNAIIEALKIPDETERRKQATSLLKGGMDTLSKQANFTGDAGEIVKFQRFVKILAEIEPKQLEDEIRAAAKRNGAVELVVEKINTPAADRLVPPAPAASPATAPITPAPSVAPADRDNRIKAGVKAALGALETMTIPPPAAPVPPSGPLLPIPTLAAAPDPEPTPAELVEKIEQKLRVKLEKDAEGEWHVKGRYIPTAERAAPGNQLASVVNALGDGARLRDYADGDTGVQITDLKTVAGKLNGLNAGDLAKVQGDLAPAPLAMPAPRGTRRALPVPDPETPTPPAGAPSSGSPSPSPTATVTPTATPTPTPTPASNPAADQAKIIGGALGVKVLSTPQGWFIEKFVATPADPAKNPLTPLVEALGKDRAVVVNFTNTGNSGVQITNLSAVAADAQKLIAAKGILTAIDSAATPAPAAVPGTVPEPTPDQMAKTISNALGINLVSNAQGQWFIEKYVPTATDPANNPLPRIVEALGSDRATLVNFNDTGNSGVQITDLKAVAADAGKLASAAEKLKTIKTENELAEDIGKALGGVKLKRIESNSSWYIDGIYVKKLAYPDDAKNPLTPLVKALGDGAQLIRFNDPDMGVQIADLNKVAANADGLRNAAALLKTLPQATPAPAASPAAPNAATPTNTPASPAPGPAPSPVPGAATGAVAAAPVAAVPATGSPAAAPTSAAAPELTPQQMADKIAETLQVQLLSNKQGEWFIVKYVQKTNDRVLNPLMKVVRTFNGNAALINFNDGVAGVQITNLKAMVADIAAHPDKYTKATEQLKTIKSEEELVDAIGTALGVQLQKTKGGAVWYIKDKYAKPPFDADPEKHPLMPLVKALGDGAKLYTFGDKEMGVQIADLNKVAANAEGLKKAAELLKAPAPATPAPAPALSPEAEARVQLQAINTVLAQKLEDNLDPAKRKMEMSDFISLGGVIASRLPEEKREALKAAFIAAQEHGNEPDKQLALAARMMREGMAQLIASDTLKTKKAVDEFQDFVKTWTETPADQLAQEVKAKMDKPLAGLAAIPEMPEGLKALPSVERAKALHVVLANHLKENLAQDPAARKMQASDLISLGRSIARQLPEAEGKIMRGVIEKEEKNTDKAAQMEQLTKLLEGGMGALSAHGDFTNDTKKVIEIQDSVKTWAAINPKQLEDEIRKAKANGATEIPVAPFATPTAQAQLDAAKALAPSTPNPGPQASVLAVDPDALARLLRANPVISDTRLVAVVGKALQGAGLDGGVERAMHDAPGTTPAGKKKTPPDRGLAIPTGGTAIV